MLSNFDGITRPNLEVLRQASSGALDKAKLMVGLKSGQQDVESQQPAERTMLDEVGDLLCPDLTFQQRLIGFGTCFTFGYLITFMSFKFFIELIEGYPVPFAVNYTAGNVLAQGASWFLCGPKRQFRNMFDERRKGTATLYLSCMVATLVVVFLPLPWAPKLATLVILLLTQCGASFWYSLSYVPFGRQTVKKIIVRMFGISQYNEPPAEGS